MSKVDTFSKLFRELEAELGTSDMSVLILEALLDSLDSFDCHDCDDFCQQFLDLVETVSSTEPKFGIINYNFAKLMKEFQRGIQERNLCERRWKSMVVKKVKEILADGRDQRRKLVGVSEGLDVEGKTILIHDHSHTVQEVLVHYKYLGKNFKVVVAEQDFEKTHSIIERLHRARICFQVVPAYMLSHVHDSIDMVFFGAVTLKDTMHFVMDPGTLGIISEFHIEKVPIYMFISSKKFSLWKSKKRGEIFIHKHKRGHHEKNIQYNRIKYSHDRVPVNLFKKIVTNEGIYTPKALEKLFNSKMKKYGKVLEL